MKVRYLIKYTKESEIKFISHLDLMRTIQRTIRRADLPIEYSKGFNPHMTISIAQPLSVGVYSSGEYMDVVFKEEMPLEEIVNLLNENAPIGIKFLDAKKVEKEENTKCPQAMAIIDEAKYKIKLRTINSEEALEGIKKLNNIKEWNTIKKSKKGEKDVDIRPLIKKISFSKEDNYIVLNSTLACGSRANLSASLLADFIKNHVDAIEKDAFVDIERIDMYALKGKTMLPLNEYF
ncbi:TIGR03936 family radical SAM-associated protein [Clostridium sp. ATCC 25772]|uniref:TIGR03936 family radical SAM-associated protein n=1 Tax=Clostridium sp. ATCC 25772 TaxID=1676991 RepID=UPI000AF94F83|nr:TIGR03936 family radical SAM-associated protein [Clostridium sp. ATCC 25772]